MLPDLPWMAIADGEMGQAEVPGGAHNQRIVGYAREIGASWVQDDETPWCAGFVGACLARAGLKQTGSMLARSYLKWGVECEPKPGAVVVLKRGRDPASGHVGFLVERRAGKVFILGGNQGNQVSIAGYLEADVLGYRWPADFRNDVAEATMEIRPAPPQTPQATVKPTPKPRTRVEVAAKSRTIWSSLVALAGWVILQLQDGLRFALDAAAGAADLQPVRSLLVEAGANLKTIGAGMIVGGIVFAISRRIADGDRGDGEPT